jgi:hypothetical protein
MAHYPNPAFRASAPACGGASAPDHLGITAGRAGPAAMAPSRRGRLPATPDHG